MTTDITVSPKDTLEASVPDAAPLTVVEISTSVRFEASVPDSAPTSEMAVP